MEDELEKLEVKLLLEAIHTYYGFDFRNYSYSSVCRSLRRRVHLEKLRSISGLQEKVFHEPGFVEKLVSDFSITVTDMFRDPEFFLSFRKNVVPLLKNHRFIRIWHAGCSTGEEVYSMAILLREEGLYEKSRIYATDMNEKVLAKAKEGHFPLARMQSYTRNYIDSGGTGSFSEYYTVLQKAVRFHSTLAEHIVFAQHNLVTDGSFNEFHVILCRNVMIYFDKFLQNRVHGLFYESLCPGGVLGLGNRESMAFTTYTNSYEEIDPNER